MPAIYPDAPNTTTDNFTVAPTSPEQPMEEESHGGGHGSVLYMNLTPMIDMVFNLLIFFVMVAGGGGNDAFLQSKLPKSRGVASGDAVEQKQAVTIKLTRRASGLDEGDCSYVVAERGVTFNSYENLYNYLEQLRASAGDDTPINIEPMPNVKWVHAANVFNTAMRAGFKSIAFSSVE